MVQLTVEIHLYVLQSARYLIFMRMTRSSNMYRKQLHIWNRNWMSWLQNMNVLLQDEAWASCRES